MKREARGAALYLLHSFQYRFVCRSYIGCQIRPGYLAFGCYTHQMPTAIYLPFHKILTAQKGTVAVTTVVYVCDHYHCDTRHYVVVDNWAKQGSKADSMLFCSISSSLTGLPKTQGISLAPRQVRIALVAMNGRFLARIACYFPIGRRH